MLKSKAHPKAQAKKTISTSALFKRPVGVEKKKHGRRAAHKPEHPLATAFSDSIDQSAEQIKTRVDAELSPILANFITRLQNDSARSMDLAQQAIAQNNAITQPLDDIELDWESNDKSRFGKTTLGNRIKKLEKVIKTEEESMAKDTEQLRDLNLELDHMALEVLGEDAYEQVLNGTLDWSLWDPQQEALDEAYGVDVELELEKARWADIIEATNAAALKEMEESEKVLNLRQDKIQQSFYQLLRDEDYY